MQSLTQPWDEMPRYARLEGHLHEETVRKGYFEFSVSVTELAHPAEEVNFRLGNIVTDARSCLDMAIEQIWKEYGIDRSFGRKGTLTVQFPLEDNFEEKRKSERLQAFLARMDERFVEVIEAAQPDYTMRDIPGNISALFIRNFSNANKHRNITPVQVVQDHVSTGTNGYGLKLDRIGDPQVEKDLRFALTYKSEHYSESEARSWLPILNDLRACPIHVTVMQRLVVTGDELLIYPPRLGGQGVPWRAELDDLLRQVPAYVRLTLRNLNRVHNIIREGGDAFYMLDWDGAL